jgi:hypothetical protein
MAFKWVYTVFLEFFIKLLVVYTYITFKMLKLLIKQQTYIVIQFCIQYMGKRRLLLPQIHNFRFSILLETEYLNFLCKHNTLLTGTAEWVNLNVKFWQDNHTKACNQNSSFRHWHCNLTTNKAIYKNVKQVISIHRHSKKGSTMLFFTTALHKMQQCTAIYRKSFRKWKQQANAVFYPSMPISVLHILLALVHDTFGMYVKFTIN